MSRPKALIDSSVWIELFGRGKRVKAIEKVLAEFRVVGVPALVFFEVCRRVSKANNPEAALSVAGYLRQFGSIDLTDEIAIFATDLSIEWKLSMADSIMLAHAKTEGATLVTLDNDFSGLPGVKVLRA